MDRDIKVGIIVITILIITIVSIPTYFAITSPKVEVTGTTAISTNPGLSVNVTALGRYVHIDQNLTALFFLHPDFPVTINNVSVATPGFSIVSMNTSLPLTVDQNLTLSLVLKSSQPYSGSVLFFINAINASDLAEKILVPDVVADTSSKTVVMVSVFNAGDIPLTNSTAYLVRSDGLVVNSTTLPSEGIMPGKISYFDIDVSYSEATILEVYKVKVVMASGANATSRVFALTCNC